MRRYIPIRAAWGLAFLGALLLAPATAFAQDGLPLEERLSILEDELENVKLEKATKSYQSYQGMGPAASGVYEVDQGLSWGGYGEVKYYDYQSDYKKDQTDVHRFILYAGYRFNDWIVLNSEIEYEHAGFVSEEVVKDVETDSQGRVTSVDKGDINEGEVFVEFAYIDFEFAKEFQLQLGLNLIPVGITNLRHEPTTFLAVDRPSTEKDIIPSTWREIGAIFKGELGEVAIWRAGILTGPRGSNFSSDSWIRGGRTKGSLSISEDWAGFVGLDLMPAPGVLTGASYYVGDSGQGEIDGVRWDNTRLTDPLDAINDGTGVIDAFKEIRDNRNEPARVRVHIAEAHFEYNGGPWKLRSLYTQGWMNDHDTRAVNRETGNNVGRRVWGGYGEIGYNVLSHFNTGHKLYPFVRYERLNTQWETVERHLGGREDIEDYVCSTVLNGTCRTTSQLSNGNRTLGYVSSVEDVIARASGVVGKGDPTNDRTILTLGMAYFPTDNVVLKGEYMRNESKSDLPSDIESRNSGNNKIDRINFAVGFIF